MAIRTRDQGKQKSLDDPHCKTKSPIFLNTTPFLPPDYCGFFFCQTMENMEKIKKKTKIMYNSITTVNILVHCQSFSCVGVLLTSPFMRDLASSYYFLWSWPQHLCQHSCVLFSLKLIKCCTVLDLCCSRVFL